MRLKIIGGPIAIVAVAGLIAYLAVWGSLRHRYAAQLEKRLPNETALLTRSFAAEGLRLQQILAARLETDQVAAMVSSAAGEVQRRTRAFEAANAVAGFLADPAQGQSGKPDVVVVTDERGQVIARDLDPNRMHGTLLANEVAGLQDTLRTGQAAEDLWNFQGKLLRATMVPLRAAGNVVGAVVVGYDLSAGVLERQAQTIGHDIALILNGEIYATSLQSGARQKFKDLCAGALQTEVARALSSHEVVQWKDKDSSLQGALASWTSASQVPAVVAVVANRNSSAARTSTALIILLITALALGALFGYGLAISTALLKPLEALEEGVFAVINGRADQRIDIDSQEFGGLAYRVNQLINLYTGVAEQDEEGRAVASTGSWKMNSDPPPKNGATAGHAPNQDARATELGAEPEAQYQARVYREYVQAKQRIGEDVSNISQDRFLQRLSANADHLIKKNGCRMVRFEVQVDGSQVNLVPVMIR